MKQESVHWSDCAVHNAPAYPVGLCDCDVAQEPYDQTALELCEVCGWKTLIPDDGCLNCERTQPAQEPVAWITPDGERFRIRFSAPTNEVPLGWDALYTTPPQRPWVGLTDEEIIKIHDAWTGKNIGFITGLVEAKLKEKNT